MNPTPPVHPYLLGELAPMFSETVTVQRAENVTGNYGAVTPEWSDLPGHADIPATVAPVLTNAGEVHGGPRIVLVGMYQIALLGRFAAIRSADRVVWGDRTLDITNVVHAAHGIYTLLAAREVR